MDNVQDIAKTIFRHLLRCSVDNQHGVKFEVQDDHSLIAEARISMAQENVDIYYELFETKERFVELFKIKKIRDLYQITKDELKGMFLQGKASIVCRVDISYSYFLTYRLVDGILMAENERFVKHRVDEVLNSAEDYVKYTRNYYTLIDSCEN